MFGAGTDYCLLLISRYRANLRQGCDTDAAVGGALAGAAPAMTASGATVDRSRCSRCSPARSG